ncbi:MAG TPA: hypothetical protein VJR27_03120 [Candidatus Saccharimonadales bacterium]|nr:hypothetical protein [Candidatus Saccharimonadales bacterium]
MSDPNRFIETRPTVSMDFSMSMTDTPPPEVVFFDSMALAHPKAMQTQLSAWPPEQPPKSHEQPAYDIHTAIAGVVLGSRHGRTIDYDDTTWAHITSNPAYEEENRKMQSLEKEGSKADPQHEQVTVRGLAVYVERLNKFVAQNKGSENVA